ncbi:hypothetical protein HDU96_010749 [Phlyctochytrium bullatum]|nr:hypothetical protein HDU96_010749 [Phlyctochytrium bullatum]
MAQENLEAALAENVVPRLSDLLAALLTVAEARKAAEDEILNEWLPKRPGELFAGLTHIMRYNPQTDLRMQSAVLLRRLALTSVPAAPNVDLDLTYWSSVPWDVRAYVKQSLINALTNETLDPVRHKICDTISDLARDSKSNPQEASAIIRGHLNDNSASVKVAAVKAAVTLFRIVGESADPDAIMAFQGMIPQLLNAVASITSDEMQLRDGLSALIDMSEHARLFRQELPQMVTFLTGIMKTEDFDPTVRQLALELLLCLAEARPPMVRKCTPFAATLIPLLLEWMASIEDSPVWHNTDSLLNDDEDGDEFHIVAEQAMDRISLSLGNLFAISSLTQKGGRSVLPITFNILPSMLGNSSWSQRHAGLMAISVIAEGCKDVMIEKLSDIVELVLPYLRDEHPRVRYAACNAIGQMCTDFAPMMQDQFCAQILQNLIPVMDDTSSPRVQAHCAAALVNLAEDVQKEQIQPFLHDVFGRLVNLLGSNKTYVQEQAITTIATIADSAEEYFREFYSQIMPLLMSIVKEASDKSHRLLRSKAIECVSLIALAVKKETFAPHTQEFLEILLAIQRMEKDPDDPITSYLLVAWARMCKVIGDEFIPYLEIVIPPLLEAAGVKPDVAILDVEESEEDYPEEEGWEFSVIQGQKIGIKTSALEDKHTAVEMLACYARDLRRHFHPFVKASLELCVSLLRFYFHDGVRHAAVSTLPLLFTCMIDAGFAYDYILADWIKVSTAMMEILESETDADYPGSVFAALADSVAELSNEYLGDEVVGEIIAKILRHLGLFHTRINERTDHRKDADYDDVEEQALQDEEDNDDSMLIQMARVISELFKKKKAAFLPVFDHLLPTLNAMAVFPLTSARHFTACVFGDLIQHGGPQSWAYHTHFVELLGKGLMDQAPEMRQASAYAVGLAAQEGGPDFYPMCVQAIPLLQTIIQSDVKRDDETVLATENAIAALGRILRFLGDKNLFDFNAVLGVWFHALPILNDQEECEHTYEYFITLLESSHPVIVGENQSNLAHIIKVLASLLGSDLKVENPLQGRLINALKTLLVSVSENEKTAIWNSLSPGTRQVLKIKMEQA